MWRFLIILTLLLASLPVADARAAETEIAYDDGSAEGSVYVGAVRFTPTEYPVELRRIRFYNWSVESGFNKMWMYDDDGPGGSPGTLLFGPISFLAWPQLHWLEFELPDSLQTVVEQGDFYIEIQPADRDPLAPPLGQDVDGLPQSRSWTLEGDTWSQLAPELGNLMIRVTVEQTPVPVQPTTWGRIKALYGH